MIPSSRRGLLAAAAICVLACASPRPAGSPSPAGSLVVPLTVTAASDPSCWRCHEAQLGEKGRAKVVHAPFLLHSGCVACHGAHAGPPSKAGLLAPQPELCRRCHRAERFRGPNLHSAIESSGCTACHDPHGAAERRLLSSTVAALCGRCHDAVNRPQHRELAIADDRCVLCHDPHSSPRPKLLPRTVHEALSDCRSCHEPRPPTAPLARSAQEPALCLQCHDGVEKELARKSAHPPAKEGPCTQCHSPHAGDRPGMLVEERPALCLPCHDGVEKKIRAAGAHPPARDGRCGDCHAAHGAERPKLLVAPAGPLCFRCHPRAQDWAGSRSSHDPVREGDCGACHDPHGGGPKLLVKSGGELCATCHDVQATERARKKGHPPVAQGACRTCHLPHASDLEQLAAERIEDLCVRCHGAMYEARAGARLHRPFQARRCGVCHVAHGGMDALVRAPNPCAACHSAATGRWASARSRHGPVAEGRCAACHEPHGGGAARFLRRTGAELCLGCHEPLAKRLAAAGATIHAPVRECVLGEVSEGRSRPQPVVGRHRLPGDLPEGDDDHGLAEQGELPREVRRAIGPFVGLGLVPRRRAVHGRRDVGAGERQAVVSGRTRRLRRVSGPVQRGEEPVARAVAREHPSRPVAAVSSRRQPDQQ